MIAEAGPPLALLTIAVGLWWAVSAALWPSPRRARGKAGRVAAARS